MNTCSKIVVISLAISSLMTFSSCAGPSLNRYANLVRPEPPGAPRIIPQAAPARGVRVTYFGTNSYLLQSPQCTVLIDPYFTRVGPLWALGLGKSVESRSDRINEGFKYLPPRADLILVTHSHFDHLGDVPTVAQHTGAAVALSPTGKNLAISAGGDRRQFYALLPGKSWHSPGVRATAIDADHTQILGNDIYPGSLNEPPPRPPKRMNEWVAGEPLAWLIEMNGQRIYVESGGVRKLPPRSVGPVDLAIIGVPAKDSLRRFPELVRLLRPRYLLPSHQDDFTRPLSQGFRFSSLSNMEEVRRIHRERQLPGEMILLDYYRPWILQ